LSKLDPQKQWQAAALQTNSSNLTERSLNVYENKGLLWKTWEQSLNVIENKGT
jgi:hypothetical protein